MGGGRTRKWRPWSAVAALAMAFAASLAFQIALVPTTSMTGTILAGDHLLIFKLLDAPRLPATSLRFPRIHQPARGEVISFQSPRSPADVLLKRVIGISGDTLEIRDHRLYRNGMLLDEPYASPSHVWRTMPPVTVPPGALFVMGDNRDQSEDSRHFGPVQVANVIGHPLLVLWSYDAPASAWLHRNGDLRLSAYWTAALHFFAGTRWRRVARLV